MELLQGTFLFLSMCSLCYSQENQDPTTMTTSQSLRTVTTTASPSTTTSEAVETSVNTSEKLSTPVATESVNTSSVGTRSSSLVSSPNTGTLKEPSSMPTISTKSSFVSTVAKTERGTSQTERPSNASKTTSLQSSDHQFQSTVSTTQSSNKSTNTLEMITTPYIKNQENSKDSGNTSSLLTNPSYSSVILPVVIALIAITLSVFTLVGLYRMCWKTDPGTPDNGTDQPQSDKESVKLLTVKTISPETSEQSAQGKNKN
ncbi:endomucin isoform X2 [Notamacropus eugenii]|uniref:endomucin isoform X2 n=1 Tax=Notamacropus eugenii TaxID=9315 RepID=UPI003B6819C9